MVATNMQIRGWSFQTVPYWVRTPVTSVLFAEVWSRRQVDLTRRRMLNAEQLWKDHCQLADNVHARRALFAKGYIQEARDKEIHRIVPMRNIV